MKPPRPNCAGPVRDLSCADANGPFTRPVNVVAQLSCDSAPWTDAAVLHLDDPSRCTAVTSVSSSLVRQ